MSTSPTEKAAALTDDLRRIFSERLLSVATYGDVPDSAPLTCLVLVASVDTVDLDACARAAPRWHRHGFATPLILPEHEFRRSVDAFPLEYHEMLRTHRRVYGHDPFTGMSVAPEDLRRACETQVKSHLLHLREEYIEAGGQPKAVAAIVSLAAPAFAALLRHVGWLHGIHTETREAAALAGAQLAGLSDDVVTAVLALERPREMPSTDPARLFPRYLAAVEQLAAFVDSWRAA